MSLSPGEAWTLTEEATGSSFKGFQDKPSNDGMSQDPVLPVLLAAMASLGRTKGFLQVTGNKRYTATYQSPDSQDPEVEFDYRGRSKNTLYFGCRIGYGYSYHDSHQLWCNQSMEDTIRRWFLRGYKITWKAEFESPHNSGWVKFSFRQGSEEFTFKVNYYGRS
jgi:hypothetical protein